MDINKIKQEKGLTDKQAQEFLKQENMTAEEIEVMRKKLQQEMETPFQTWNNFDPSKVFGK